MTLDKLFTRKENEKNDQEQIVEESFCKKMDAGFLLHVEQRRGLSGESQWKVNIKLLRSLARLLAETLW